MTPELRAVARQQGGAFRWDQAVDLSGRAWLRTATRRGDVLNVLPRIYVPATAPVDERLLAHATQLWAGPDAALAEETAALRHGIGQRSAAPHVTVALPESRRGGTTPPWLSVVRTTVIQATMVDLLRVTTLARTIADLARKRSERDLHAIVLQEVQARRLKIEDLVAVVDVLGTRQGVAVVRRIVAEYDPGFESLLTFELLDLAHRAGIEQAEVGRTATLRNGRIVHLDIAVMEWDWDLEADGWAYHSSRTARSGDTKRDRAMALAGWQTDRFTTEDIRRNPLKTRRELSELARVRERAARRRSA